MGPTHIFDLGRILNSLHGRTRIHLVYNTAGSINALAYSKACFLAFQKNLLILQGCHIL